MQKVKERIINLVRELNAHNYNYYVLDKPTISDYEFDLRLQELIDFEKQYPAFVLPDSPTQRVGGEITKQFEHAKHSTPMLSLGNTYNKAELQAFDARVKAGLQTNQVEYVCELKYDGVAIALIYEQSKLKQAITR